MPYTVEPKGENFTVIDGKGKTYGEFLTRREALKKMKKLADKEAEAGEDELQPDEEEPDDAEDEAKKGSS